jgi:hypothetical protein
MVVASASVEAFVSRSPTLSPGEPIVRHGVCDSHLRPHPSERNAAYRSGAPQPAGLIPISEYWPFKASRLAEFNTRLTNSELWNKLTCYDCY